MFVNRSLSLLTLTLTAVLSTSAQAALDNGYALIVGEPIYAQLEPQSCPIGSYLHYQMWVKAPAGQGKTYYRKNPSTCAKNIKVCDNCFEIVVDVFNSSSGTQVAHREVVMSGANAVNYYGVFAKPAGMHVFATWNNLQDFNHGNLDLLRHRGVLNDIANQPMLSLDGASNPLVIDPDGNPATKNNTIPMYDAMFADVLASGGRIYAFGEPYNDKKGMHNVHQNQGNLVGSNFAYSNGIWQDGAVIFETLIRGVKVRTLTMVRFQAQKDFTHEYKVTDGVKRGDGVASRVVVNLPGSAVANGMVHYGPYVARQIQVELTGVTGNPDLYVKPDDYAWPGDYYQKSTNASGQPEYIRSWLSPQGQGPLYISVHAKDAGASWNLKLTYTPEWD